MASPFVLLKSAVFTVLVPGTVAGLIPRVLAPYDRESSAFDSTVVRSIGRLALASGGLLYLHTAFRFADEGRGTPSPSDEPDELVTGGIYARVRNPMYVAVVLFVFGQAIRYRSLHVFWYGIVCWLGFHNRVVTFEEPHLAEKHGDAYEEYRARVPRWIPRVRKA